ncbi:G-type lectin S-receptor-like serine/threonine-protein kinase At1g34300 [Macadamia integrifolia]|uniref:G-type lectin S-receptor-like serine/threonine-protein kinase At1g34300 n=1 Tax=Macadamia integrifolia TaxID=60698 RepID=UPI001C4FD05F|nr:G-type lectin S-receptor-like serine/threonine-protein kinase At1g34300 [Macadamia integrifolia]
MAICFLHLLLLPILLLSNLSPSTAQEKLSSFNISYSPWSPTLNRILVSTNSIFAAGFRPLPTNQNLYIFAIWYQNSSDKTIAWSLNGNSTVTSSSSLVISSSGTLELNDSTGKNLWQPTTVDNSPGAGLVLHGNGSLMFGNWDSFKYPTDTILPNQIINGTTLVSKNGKFMFVNSSKLIFNSSNYWDEHTFNILTSDGNITKTDDATPWLSADVGSSRLHRLTLDDDGNLRVYSLDPVLGSWKVVWQVIQELCTIHGTCGENYICMTSNGSNSTTYCVCPPGFRVRNTTAGEVCERAIPLRPRDSKFLRLDFVDFGDDNETQIQVSNFSSCKSGCVSNPSCLAFVFKFDGTETCIQLHRLIYGYWSPATENSMFLRVSDSDTSETNFTSMATKVNTICSTLISLPSPPKESNTTTRNIAILSTLFAFEFLIGFLSFWAFIKKYIKYRDMAQVLGLELLTTGGPKRYSHAELKTATNNFSNVIGHGGFGVVYKGELPDHRIVAVKCLKDVAGGEAEFWAEVTIIARMHHLNLVRMWGFCAEKGQRMLVYEYIPNGSLAHFLFHANRDEHEPGTGTGTGTGTETDTETGSVPVQPRPILDWNVRYRIAQGVARAIAYLHEECLEWVLHCDIKPENILLEDDFCPKVSDFGLSKLTKKEDKVSMSRIRGTRGYLAPEWVKMEPITAKADVYSFGMVLLEIVSGMRNYEFRRSSVDSEEWYFPRWAFEKVYKEMNVDDLLDGRIKHCYDSSVHFEIVDRMVKTAMWCLQDKAEMRPSMGKVTKMLEGTVEITEPAKPTIFYIGDDE